MSDHSDQQLLDRVQRAIDSRPIPALERNFADDDDWQRLSAKLHGLWNEGPAPPLIVDLTCIGLAWFTEDQFRFAFLRLIESALRHPEAEVDYAIMEAAAVPVPRGCATPPARFCEFSADEVRLVSQCIKVFERRRRTEDVVDGNLPEPLNRVINRALRNWGRFAAQIDRQSSCSDA